MRKPTEQFLIESHLPGMKLAVSVNRSPKLRPRPLLYIHGATFPSAPSVGYQIEGLSWSDHLCDAGFDVWAFDFLGHGQSERFAPSFVGTPCRAEDAARQIESTVRFILSRENQGRIAILAHSWGTMPAAVFSSRHPHGVADLVLFGPVAARGSGGPSPKPEPFHLVTADHQWAGFIAGVPADAEPPLDAKVFDAWIDAYLATDPQSGSRTPRSVLTPGGPMADLTDCGAGRYPCDLARVTSPTLVIRGEWDAVCNEDDALWLTDRLSSARSKTSITLPRGAHRIHLEHNRMALFEAVKAFLLQA